jgi:hypothetical protein
MRGQAQSFSSLNKHMQQIYGSDLTKKVWKLAAWFWYGKIN